MLILAWSLLAQGPVFSLRCACSCPRQTLDALRCRPRLLLTSSTANKRSKPWRTNPKRPSETAFSRQAARSLTLVGVVADGCSRSGSQRSFSARGGHSDRPGYRHDVDRAKALLRASGYKGEQLDYRLIPGYYLQSESAALMIIEMWRRIGINVRLELVKNWKEVRGPGVEIYAWSNTIRLPDPVGGLLVSWGRKSAIQNKYKFWAAPAEFNRLGVTVARSGDPRRRYAAFQRMLDIFEDEMPGTILYSPFTTYGVRRNIQWTPYPIYFMDFRPDAFSIRPRSE